MYFQERFEFGRYGAQFQKSYAIFKLLDRNQTLAFNRAVADATKGLDNKEAIEALGDAETIINLMYGEVAKAWESGEIYDEELKAERPMKKADIDSFPTKVIRDLVAFIQGTLEKKD